MKLILAFSTVLLLSGCSSDEGESTDDIAIKEMKDFCEKVGGQLAFGIEVTHHRFYETLTTGYYCIAPKTEEIR